MSVVVFERVGNHRGRVHHDRLPHGFDQRGSNADEFVLVTRRRGGRPGEREKNIGVIDADGQRGQFHHDPV